MKELSRIMVFNRLDAYVCDLDPARIQDLRSVEEINGEHALTLTTTHQLEKTNRIVLNDGMGNWHEYVVTGIVDTHETDQGIVTEYYCVWSIQYDLSGTFVNDQYGCGIVPGHASVPHPVQDGLAIALSTTNRWQIGTVNVTSMAAASFYRRSGWEAIQTVIEKWGGELQATITVGQDGVVSRAVDLLAHVGASTATRRFDYGHDVASIKRTVSDEVWPCRIIPLGASQETDEGGYTRRPTIESVNDGVMWLEDSEAVPYTRIPDGNGGWEYPTVIVENDTYEEPTDLKAWALANITDYTRPRVTYEASVVQLARAGMNAHGVALGDEVVIVDREFGGDGLRISARVVKQECNLLDPTDTVLTIGNITDKLSGQLADLSRQVSEVAEQVANASSYQSSTEYVSRLLERINNEANATGGFTYITEGEGIRTYDVAVTDPAVGAEANAVVEIKGGTVRIANTKDSSGQWEWKIIFTSGYVNAEVIRAIGMTSGSHVEVDANGVHIFNQDGTEVATYSGVATIGQSNQTRAEVAHNGLRLIDREGDTYLYVGDMRDENGLYLMENESHAGYFYTEPTLLTDWPIATDLPSGYPQPSVTVDGSAVACEVTGTNQLTLSGSFVSGTVYTALVTYYTDSQLLKEYDIGMRGTDASHPVPGAMSYVEGYGNIAAGHYSHAEGYNTKATGDWSHAEGRNTQATGSEAHAEGVGTVATSLGHAEGWDTQALGSPYPSHAQGRGTIAGRYQLAMGRWNVDSTSGNLAFIIGNGSMNLLTEAITRSNAFSVDFDGSVVTRSESHAGNESVSANTALHKFDSYDKDNQNIGYTQIIRTTSGVYRSFAVRNRDTGKAAALYVYSNDDGTMLLTLASGMTFDLNRFPTVNRAHGGTGVTGRQSSSVSLSNASSTSTNHCWHNGVVATVSMSGVTLKSALASASSVTVGTVPSGYRPADNVYAACVVGNNTYMGKLYVRITSAGAVVVVNRSGSSFSTSETFAFTITYAI